MGDPQKTVLSPGRTDIRFDFVDQLPLSVPPVELPATSMFPFQSAGPKDATYYFPIFSNDPKTSCNPTGVFFPDGYGYPDKINVIIYFHGFKLGQFVNINDYWKGLNKLELRHDINQTGKKVVLIAPTLGSKPGSSNLDHQRIFKDAGGTDLFLKEVATFIGKYVPQYKSKGGKVSFDKIVLAGHSGAGQILLTQAKTMKTHVCEVWGFDSMYGMEKVDVADEWKKTAQSQDGIDDYEKIITATGPVTRLRPATHFYFYYASGSPISNSQNLEKYAGKAKLNNVTVLPNRYVSSEHTGFHFDAVAANFRTRVAAASCFS